MLCARPFPAPGTKSASNLRRFRIHSPFLETFSLAAKDSVSPRKSEGGGSGGGKIVQLQLKRGEREEAALKIFFPLESAAALRRMQERSALIESVFHPKPAPYFAVLTKEISCPKEFLPRIETGNFWKSFRFFANKRKGVGVCNREDVFFLNIRSFLYCPPFFIEADYFRKVTDRKESLETAKPPGRLISCDSGPL